MFSRERKPSITYDYKELWLLRIKRSHTQLERNMSFPSALRALLWELLRLRRIPALLSDVKCGRGMSSFNLVYTGVCPRCPLSFIALVRTILDRPVNQSPWGAFVSNSTSLILLFCWRCKKSLLSRLRSWCRLSRYCTRKQSLWDFISPGRRQSYWCLETCWMEQLSLFIRVARTLKNWKASHILVVLFIAAGIVSRNY